MNAVETSAVPVLRFGAGRFASFLNAVEAVLQWLGALILAVLLVLVLTSVTLRYVFGSGRIWS
jgi:TRAP-type C4-dicarboxylate transport system permease small subunit